MEQLLEVLQVVLKEEIFSFRPIRARVIVASLMADYASLLPDVGVQPLGAALACEFVGWKRESCRQVLQASLLPQVCAQIVQTYLKFRSKTLPHKYPREVSLCVVVRHRQYEIQ